MAHWSVTAEGLIHDLTSAASRDLFLLPRIKLSEATRAAFRVFWNTARAMVSRQDMGFI